MGVRLIDRRQKMASLKRDKSHLGLMARRRKFATTFCRSFFICTQQQQCNQMFVVKLRECRWTAKRIDVFLCRAAQRFLFSLFLRDALTPISFGVRESKFRSHLAFMDTHFYLSREIFFGEISQHRIRYLFQKCVGSHQQFL